MKLTELAASSWEDANFTVSKVPVGDKIRTLSIPSPGMRALHGSLLKRIRKIPDVDMLLFHSFGALSGRSAVENATWHAGSRHFYQLDIKDAYPSVPLKQLARCLRRLDPSLGTINENTDFLERYCAGPEGGLAVGAPASPALFDLYCAHMIDLGIRALIDMPGTIYTRYLDDLTISSDRPIPAVLRKRIRTVVEEAGFRINHQKSVVRDVQFARVPITGALITKQGFVHPADEHLARLKELMRPPYTRARAREFAGLASYVRTFEILAEARRLHMSEHVTRFLKSVRRHLRALPDQGLLPRSFKKTAHMKVPEHLLEEIRRRTDLVEIGRRYHELKRSGHEFIGLSPFTKEKTPSFYVVPDKGFWYDFSSGRHGDAFALVMHFESCDFLQAVRMLAKESGVPLPGD
jgi:hypothetical protein